MNIGKIVQHYVSLRETKRKMEARHKEELAPLKQDLEQIENALQKVMLDQGVKSLKTEYGTPYLAEQTRSQVTDWEAVQTHIVEHQEWDAFERRVSKSWLQEQSGQIPGVELVSFLKCNIRK
jgi:hypothetical protein